MSTPVNPLPPTAHVWLRKALEPDGGCTADVTVFHSGRTTESTAVFDSASATPADELYDLLSATALPLDEDKVEEPCPVILLIDADLPELHAVPWEALPRMVTGSRRGDRLRVVRSLRGPDNFRPERVMTFADLPVRVLFVGAGSEAESPWHEDVAVHSALRELVTRWEVDVLPGPVMRDELERRLEDVQPHILHLTGDTPADLRRCGLTDFSAFNLSHVRLVISSCTGPDGEELLASTLCPDAQDPVLGTVMLRPEEGACLCKPVSLLYDALARGLTVDRAVEEATCSQSGATATVTVNCHPDRILSVGVPSPLPHQDVEASQAFYGKVRGAADRVAQRRLALDRLRSGADISRLLTLFASDPGGDGQDPQRAGVTFLLLSLLRAWEADGGRALYVDFEPLATPRHPGPPNLAAEMCALLADSARKGKERYRDWEIDDELRLIDERVAELRQYQERGSQKRSMVGVRSDIMDTARDLVVKLVPQDAHLVLALDQCSTSRAASDEELPLLLSLIRAIRRTGAAVSTVVTTSSSSVVTWADGLEVAADDIALERWPKEAAAPLLREIGARLGIDWHSAETWRARVAECVELAADGLGPALLDKSLPVAKLYSLKGGTR